MSKAFYKDCENAFGELSPSYIARIKNYIDHPTIDGWEDIHSIIICSKGFITIWQALIQVDTSFPQKGRTTDIDGNIIREWERIPTEFETLRAIKIATKKIA